MDAHLRRVITSIPVPIAFMGGWFVRESPALGFGLMIATGIVDLIGYWRWTAPKAAP